MKHRKIFFAFLMTFVPMVLAAVVAVFIVGFHVVTELQQEINRQYYKNAAKVQNDLDNTLLSIMQETHSLLWDSTVVGFSLASRPLENEAVFNSYKILSTLRSRNSLSTYSRETMLYFKNSNSIITELGVSSSEAYFNKRCEKYGMSYEEWMSKISTSTQNSFTLWQTTYKGTKKTYLFFVRAISQNAASEPISSSVTIIDMDLLVSEAVRNTSLFGGNFFVFKDNDIVISQDGALPDFLTGTSISTVVPNDSTVVREQIDNNVIASMPSKVLLGWRYVTESPTSVIYATLNSIYSTVVIISFALVLIGGALTVILLVKNYNPVKRIQKLLVPQTGTLPFTENYNDIETALIEMIDAKQKSAGDVVRQANIIRQNILTDLLFGVQREHDNDPAKMKKALKEVDIEFNDEPIIAFSFFGNCNQDTLSVWEMEEEKFKPYLSSSYAVLIENALIVMASLPDGASAKKIPDGLEEELFNFCLKSSNAQCAVSSVKSDFTHLNNAYNELVVVMETAAETEKSEVIFYSTVQKKLKAAFEKAASPQTSNEFCYLISELKFENAKAFLVKLLAKNQMQSTMSLFTMKNTFFTLLSSAVARLAESYPGIDRILTDETVVFEQIANARSIETLKNVMVEAISILNDTVSHVSTPKDDSSLKHNALVSKVQEYIKANYLDPNLNVSTVAQNFNLNLSYLSKAFKDATGENVLEFINMRRVEYAKNLLRNTEDSVKAVAERSGFYDVNAFIRCLKKYEGTTPGRYRENKL